MASWFWGHSSYLSGILMRHMNGAVSSLDTGRIGVPQVVAMSSWALSLNAVLWGVIPSCIINKWY